MTGALAALPAVAVAEPAAAVAAQAWAPEILNSHQNELLIALTDLIIPETDTPGAKAAQVNRYIDRFLKDGEPSMRSFVVSGLGWVDQYANQKHGHGFLGCTNEQQAGILKALDANQEPGIATGHQFFVQLKSFTARLYYNTAIGYRELNKGGRVPRTFGCTHGGHA